MGNFPKKAAFKHLCQRAGGARILLSLAKINMVSNNGAIYKKNEFKVVQGFNDLCFRKGYFFSSGKVRINFVFRR